MDYLNRMDFMTESMIRKATFNSDETPTVPVTYELWESDDGNKIGFKATSSYDSSFSCATRLITYFYAQNFGDPALVVRDYDSNGIPVMWIPKTADMLTETEPYDTSGATNTSYKLASEPSNERAGVNVETWKVNDKALNASALNVMRQERPDLFNVDDLALEDFADWWVEVNTVHKDTVNRLWGTEYDTYYSLNETKRLRGGSNNALQTNMNNVGLYSIHSVYGYDWDAEIESQKADWSLGSGDDFLGYSWEGVGYWSLSSLYYVTFVYTFFRKTLTYALIPKVGWTLKGVGKFGLAALETIVIDIYLMELPNHIRAVDATKNYNGCGFPDGGHYQKTNVHVYDSTKTDWQGTPHCSAGESRKIETENPFTYDPEVPCCPDGSTYNATLGVCESGDGASVPDGGGIVPDTGFGMMSIPPTDSMGVKVVAGVLLGIVGITVLTGTKK
jgi:hypothetical protein